MNNRSIFRPQLLTSRLLTTAVVGILALICGFALANGPSARAAMEKVGLLQAVPAIPETFNYQGFLREVGGTPTTGTKNITSKIYAAPTGGAAIHTEEFADVNVRDGLFNVVIGDAVALGATFDQAPLYIGISVDGTELIPRERIHGVPWAIRATSAQSAQDADTARLASFANSANSATNAGTANKIVPGAITTQEFFANSLSPSVSFTGNPNACFLTEFAGTGDDSDSCLVRMDSLKLVTRGSAICKATCLYWGQ